MECPKAGVQPVPPQVFGKGVLNAHDGQAVFRVLETRHLQQLGFLPSHEDGVLDTTFQKGEHCVLPFCLEEEKVAAPGPAPQGFAFCFMTDGEQICHGSKCPSRRSEGTL